MPLAASGTISIGGSTATRSINLELGRAAGATSSLNETSLRSLAGVASGAISLSNFYGKSSGPFASYTNPAGFNEGVYEILMYYGEQAYVNLYIDPNGTWAVSSNYGSLANGTWATPVVNNAGSGLYYRRVLNNYAYGNGSSWDGTTAWGQGGGISVFVESTSNMFSVAQVDTNYTVQISTTASTAGIVSQGTFEIRTYSSPNAPN